MNPRPTDVQPLKNYELLVTFANGERRIFDVKPFLSEPLYAPLKDQRLFACAKADGMCVFWNDDIDLCPDLTYTNSHPA